MARMPNRHSAIAALLVALPSMALAEPEPLPGDRAVPGFGQGDAAAPSTAQVDYFVVNQRVGDLLAMVERDHDVRIRPTEEVRGRVSRMRLEGPVMDALAEVATRTDLDLFEFGGTIHVSAKSEATLRLVRLDGITLERAMAGLAEAGLTFAPEAARATADGAALALSGPPRMLAIAEAIVESIPPPPQVRPVPRPPEKTVRVRRGGELTMEPLHESGSNGA